MANGIAGLSERVRGYLASGQGHAWLLLAVISLSLAGRMLWLMYAPIPLAQLAYEVVAVNEVEGVVVGTQGAGLLVARDDLLLWQREESRVLAQSYVNLLQAKELYINTGTEVMRLSSEGFPGSPMSIDPRLQGAPLVSVSDRGWLHFFRDQQIWIQYAGRIEAGPIFVGATEIKPLERDWRDGVLFYTRQGWAVYIDYDRQIQYQLPTLRGTIAQAVLSPCNDYVVFAVENGNSTELWQARSDGSDQLLWASEEMTYAALDVVWSDNGRQVALAVIGYRGEGGVEDEYISITLLARPGQPQVVELNHSRGQAIAAAVPTAWSRDQQGLYIHHVHQESAVPSLYRFYRRR